LASVVSTVNTLFFFHAFWLLFFFWHSSTSFATPVHPSSEAGGFHRFGVVLEFLSWNPLAGGSRGCLTHALVFEVGVGVPSRSFDVLVATAGTLLFLFFICALL
jgi:hypothetical protein